MTVIPRPRLSTVPARPGGGWREARYTACGCPCRRTPAEPDPLPADAAAGDKKKALHDSYPFGERQHWPYRMWCAAVRDALGVRRVAKQYRPVAGDAGPSLFVEA